MYEYTQDEPNLRDAYELGLLDMTPIILTDEEANEAQFELALSMGYDAFSGLTVDEFLADAGSHERCGSQFAEEVPA